MANGYTDPNSQSTVLSHYAQTLKPHVKDRYSQKMLIIGIDPVLTPEQKLDQNCLQVVEATDLLSYLVLDTSYYRNMQFKAFRSLNGYNQMASELYQVHTDMIFLINIIGKVRHSQRMNELYIQEPLLQGNMPQAFNYINIAALAYVF